MSKPHTTPAPRRTRIEPNVYRRADGRLEIGYRDSTSKQRWAGPFDTITQARAERDKVLGAKAKGERVQPNPRLTFEQAASRWLADQVASLRPATQTIYSNAIRNHLVPRWGRRRLDVLTVDDAANLVRELRAQGLSEWTISGVLKAASRVFKFASRRLSWAGQNPVPMLENGERPKVSQTQRRRIFTEAELTQTLSAAHEPFRTLFALASVTGARLSELLGLTWADVSVFDLDAAEVRIAFQVDRTGRRQALKTQESQRTVELPRSLAAILARHRLASSHAGPESFVFATRSGRALGQRNVLRELRRAQTAATDSEGRPTFPVLSERDEQGQPVKVPRGAVPHFHSLRHSAASWAIAAGESVEEVSWQLGHKSSIVTRTVYLQEVKSAERTAHRRARMEASYGSILEAADASSPQQKATLKGAKVHTLRASDSSR